MKTIPLFFFCAAATFAFSACGGMPSGGYSVTESMSGIVSNACQTSTANLNFTESGSTVTGNTVATCYNEQLTASDNGSGVLSGVTLTLIPIGPSVGGPSYGSASQTCVFTGTLTYSNNQITGTLNLMNPQSFAPGFNGCSNSITINATKTS